jgi:hypothetical protein
MEPELRYQLILKGLIDPLSSSSGLGRACKDELYAGFSHGPFKLGGFCIILGYMDTSMTDGGKLGCPIKVKTGRETICFKDCPGYQETSLQIFLFLEQAIERFAGGESQRERACASPVLIVVSSFDGVVVSVFSLGTREAVTRAAGSLG